MPIRTRSRPTPRSPRRRARSRLSRAATARPRPRNRPQGPPSRRRATSSQSKISSRELESRLSQPQQQPQQQKPAEPGRPKQEDFQTYEEYVRADARYEARQEYLRARQEEQQQTQAKSFEERVRKADETFSEKLYDAAAKNPALMQKLQNAPTLRADLQLFGLKESETPVALAEHLADNPVLVLQLNQMPMERALREIGKIEAKLAGSSGQPVRKPSAGIPALDAVGAGQKPGQRSGDHLTQDDVISRLYPTS
jgi:hypothetical protein